MPVGYIQLSRLKLLLKLIERSLASCTVYSCIVWPKIMKISFMMNDGYKKRDSPSGSQSHSLQMFGSVIDRLSSYNFRRLLKISYSIYQKIYQEAIRELLSRVWLHYFADQHRLLFMAVDFSRLAACMLHFS